MSVELYLQLLTCSVIATILLAEAFKKLLNASDTPYRANVVALDAAMLCSTFMGLVFKTVLKLGLSFSAEQVTRLVLVILSTWIVSMVVYDKAVQTVKQYKKFKELKGGKKDEKEMV